MRACGSLTRSVQKCRPWWRTTAARDGARLRATCAHRLHATCAHCLHVTISHAVSPRAAPQTKITFSYADAMSNSPGHELADDDFEERRVRHVTAM